MILLHVWSSTCKEGGNMCEVRGTTCWNFLLLDEWRMRVVLSVVS